MSKIQDFFVVLCSVFRPALWRRFLLGKTKIRVYLRSGEHVDFWAEYFTTTRNTATNSTTSWKADGVYGNLFLDPKEIIAWKEF